MIGLADGMNVRRMTRDVKSDSSETWERVPLTEMGMNSGRGGIRLIGEVRFAYEIFK